MPEQDFFILMVVGGVFLFIGIVALLGGRREEKGYYDSFLNRSDLTRTDVREFLDHSPERPEPGALKVGGWIAVAVGIVLLALGGAFMLWM